MALQSALQGQLDRRKIFLYQPYTKQRDFHAAGSKYRERLLRAGNQLGKTYAGGAEAAYHLTGHYPQWWRGKVFLKPVAGWAGGPTGETTRDNAQRILLGRPGQHGTGLIPAKDIVDVVAARGVADLVDYVNVRHVSGGISTIKFKSYDQGREKWQGETLDFVWFDEEPDEMIYSEGLTRTNATCGIAWMTFTPLLGMSEVVRRFLYEKSADRHDTNMTIEDAEHISQEQRQKIIDSYPAHEREARTKGTPILGSGRIFPVSEDIIAVDAFPIPDYWAKIGGLDFGWDHPTAGVKIAYDRDADCVYVTNSYRVKEQTPLIHGAALKAWGSDLPWSWPHDGLQHSKDSGETLAEQYRKQGLNLIYQHAQFEDGGTGVEAGLMDMLERMQTGRLKVFRHLNDWLDEFRIYHRENGKVVKEFDDLMSATRYAIMMLRFAVAGAEKQNTDRYKRQRSSNGGSWMTA